MSLLSAKSDATKIASQQLPVPEIMIIQPIICEENLIHPQLEIRLIVPDWLLFPIPTQDGNQALFAFDSPAMTSH